MPLVNIQTHAAAGDRDANRSYFRMLRDVSRSRGSLGVYLHVPACVERCAYCDFHTVRYRNFRPAECAAAVIREIGMWRSLRPRATLDSIYFGGGTPSLLKVHVVGRILDAVRGSWPVRGRTEITLEATPRTLTRWKFQGFQGVGINRYSVGVQSLNLRDLQVAGRHHGPADIWKVGDLLAEAGVNWNADFILGFPGQDKAAWEANFRFIEHFRPPHLSVYFLELHPSTLFYRFVRTGLMRLRREPWQIRMFFRIHRVLKAMGYRHYELSNYARPGYVSRHNLRYWKVRDFLGLGPGASGCLGPWRWRNPTEWEKYRAYLKDFPRGIRAEYRSRREQLRERILLGFRTRWGVPRRWWEAYQARNTGRNRTLEKRVLQTRGSRVRLSLAAVLRLHALAGPLGLLEHDP